MSHGDHLDSVFGALADATRRGMLARLSRGTATVGELGEPFDISKAAVTKHVKVLERAGLLERDVQGRVHRCEMNPQSLAVAQRWVEQVTEFWEARLDGLAEYLEELQSGPAASERAAARRPPEKSRGRNR